jgi:2'-5' RNA ligase
MQKFTQKYTIVCFLEDKDEGYEYSANQWPSHVTLADTFSIEWDINTLVEELTNLAKRLKPISSKVSHDEYFGPNKQVLVAIIDKNKNLSELHCQIVDLLKKAGVKFNDPQYSEAGFYPHSTVQPHARVEIGETVHFNNLALVDMFPNEDAYHRKILKLIKL